MFALPSLKARINERSTRTLNGKILSAALGLILVGYTFTSVAARISPDGWVLISVAIAQFIFIALRATGKAELSATCAVRVPARGHATRGCRPPRIGEHD
jgi:protein-S-isoprenylcysteine O-methyltransferase Ste14